MTPPPRPPAALLALALLASLLACSARPAQPLSDRELRAARCLGPSQARHFAVYLHGVDSSTPSDQELENRRALDRIARELGLRIALPRAGRPCSGQPGSECWSWDFNRADLAATEATVREAAAGCFGADRPFGRIGFSNGGYILSHQFRRCELKDAPWVLTIGAGMPGVPPRDPPASLQGCGTLVTLVGTDDRWNFDPDEKFLQAIQAQGASARAVRYRGGHIVVHEPTRDALRELLAGR